MKRCAALVIVIVATFTASPASAHTRATVATDWRTWITDVPAVDGVTWRLYPAGEYVGVENGSDVPLVVLGYEGEPYLRIGPDGVEQNLNSPATYLNSRRDADVALPPRADASAAPEWSLISDEARFTWFDHRAHRMPEPGRWSSDPSGWEVPFTVDGERYSLAGRMSFDPGPPWWHSLTLAMVVIAAALALAGMRFSGDSYLRPAAIVVIAVAVLDLIHIPDEVAALPLAWIDVAFGVGHNVVFIGTALVASIIVLRSDKPSPTALLVGSFALAFHQGFLQVRQLGASQLPTIWPPSLLRFAVAASVAQLVWVSVLLVIRPKARPIRAERHLARDGALGEHQAIEAG